jgi:hypothetical protein
MISFTSSNAATISVTTASRGTTEGDARSATLKRTASYTYKVTAANSSTGSALTKDGSGVASTTISQEKNEITGTSKSGGVTTYGDVTAGTLTWTNSTDTISAAGGSVTVTAGKGSQTWSKTKTDTTYTYTSGATKTVTTENASSGTHTNIPVSPASKTFEANKKPAEASSKNTVGSQTFTWTSQYDSKKATKSATAY